MSINILCFPNGTPITRSSPNSTSMRTATAIAVIVGFVVYGFKTHNSDEFGRTVVLMILILSTVVFWALFEQSAGSMTLYADRVVDREAGGVTFTAAQFGSLNAMFIWMLAIPFAALWTWLAKKNLEPSTPAKFALGIIQATTSIHPDFQQLVESVEPKSLGLTTFPSG